MPTYERVFDLINETHVAEHIESKFGCRLLRSPQFWPVDWTVKSNGKIVSFMEIKCRKDNYTYEHLTRIGGYWIDFRKMVSFRGFEDTGGIPCHLVIRTADHKVYRWKYDRTYKFEMVYSGRYDRGADEVETQAVLPMSLFDHLMDIPVMSKDDEARIKDRIRSEGRI